MPEKQKAFIEKEIALWQEKLRLYRQGETYYKAGEIKGLDDLLFEKIPARNI